MHTQPERLALTTPPFGLRILLVLLLLGAALGSGCASAPEKSSQRLPAPDQPQPLVAALVMPTMGVVEWQRSVRGSQPFDRFEFSRRDASLNVVRRLPIQATRQWPEPKRPREERVWFEYWRQ